MKRFAGKNVVITGATRGIGLAIAEQFVLEGANVTLIGTSRERGKKALEAMKAICKDASQKLDFAALDVSKHDETKNFVQSYLEEQGHIDILVNCAGITQDTLLMKMGEDDWDAVIDVNLKSLFNLTKPFIRSMMKQRWGRIVNISSISGVTMGNPGQTNYGASKAGMIGFTKALAKEVASRNITVNCIAPGFIETEMTDKLGEQQKEAILQRVPMNRMGSPKEIAEATLFLACDAAGYISGQTLVVDGALTC